MPSQVPTFWWRCSSVNQVAVTALVSVKNATPSLPMACRSPKKDSLWPVNGKVENGTGMPTLMPTMPAWLRLANSRA